MLQLAFLQMFYISCLKPFKFYIFPLSKYKYLKMKSINLALFYLFLSVAMSLHTTTVYKLDHELQNIQLDKWRQAELQRHNYFRSLHGCPKLILDDSLNKAALDYSKTQLSIHKMTHSPQARRGKYGQNLYWGWGSPSLTYIPGKASQQWYEENKDYNYNTFKSNNPSKQVGHFTAMIWKSATKVGFGFAIGRQSGGDAIYVTANYGPIANVIGRYKENVPRPL